MRSVFLASTSSQLSPDWCLLIVQDSALVSHTRIDTLSLSLHGKQGLSPQKHLLVTLWFSLNSFFFLNMSFPWAGTESFWCFYLQYAAEWALSKCLVLAWLGSSSFSSQGQWRTIDYKPLKAGRGLQVRVCTNQGHGASCAWEGRHNAQRIT